MYGNVQEMHKKLIENKWEINKKCIGTVREHIWKTQEQQRKNIGKAKEHRKSMYVLSVR